MSTVTGPDFLALQVRDLEQAAAFYERQLGLRRAPASPPGAVVFATEPIPFAVRELLPDTDLDAGRRGSESRCGCAPTTLRPCTIGSPATACRSSPPRSTARSDARSCCAIPTGTPSLFTTRADVAANFDDR